MGFFKGNKNTAGKDDGYDSTYYSGDGEVPQDNADMGFGVNDIEVPQPETMAPKRPTAGFSGTGSTVAMKLTKPTSYREAPGIADYLLKNNAVVLNLEAANKETASNLIYFLTGVCYAINGQIKMVAANTYMLTPENMEITEESKRDEAAAQPASAGPMGGFAGYGDGYLG